MTTTTTHEGFLVLPEPLTVHGSLPGLPAEVRGKRVPMRVTAMPFAPHRYFRG